MSVLKQVRRYVRSHYGNLISVEEPLFDETNRIWKVRLKSDYPRIIQDDIDPERRTLRFLALKGLGEIQLSEDLNVTEATPRKKCVDNLNALLNLWLERAERIVVSASSYQLAKISGAKWMLNTISMLVTNLLEKKYIESWEIDSDYRPENTRRYLKMLEDLEIVEKQGNRWRYGNMFTALEEESHKKGKDFKLVVLSHVIKERYSILRELFNIRRFETFVHLDTCYYAPSLEAEKLLFRKTETLYSDYVRLYNRISPLRVRHILSELVDVGALERKVKYYYGNRELFENMLEAKSQLEEIAPRNA